LPARCGLCPGAGRSAAALDPATARAWILEFERRLRPFDAVRWYCRDGSGAAGGACSAHGGGIQHGQWSLHALALRADGYWIANLLADLDERAFVGPQAHRQQLAQILLERFLIATDDGWILRGARSYRGALQAEDEEAGARRRVRALLADPAWRAPSAICCCARASASAAQGDPTRPRTCASWRSAARDPDCRATREGPQRADAGDAAGVRSHAAKPDAAPAADYEAWRARSRLHRARAGRESCARWRRTSRTLRSPAAARHADALAPTDLRPASSAGAPRY
jgi:hypothetical protein